MNVLSYYYLLFPNENNSSINIYFKISGDIDREKLGKRHYISSEEAKRFPT
jgi:hypothetical protein